MNFWIRCQTVIGGQGNHDVFLFPHSEQGIEKDAERAIEPEDLVVQLSRVRSVTVTNGVGCR